MTSWHPDLPEFVADKIVPEPNSGCWLYVGKDPSRNGYGRVHFKGKRLQLHRVVWTLIKGPIEDGFVLDHKHCSTPACCNPDHLEPVTTMENIKRGRAVLFLPKHVYLAVVDYGPVLDKFGKIPW